MAEYSPDFQDCLDRGRLVAVKSDRDITRKELGLAKKDLEEAEGSVDRGSFRWATIQAYYAMFHAAKALVYRKGFREKSHHCLAIALRELYVRDGQLEPELIREFQDAKLLREEANYRGVLSEPPARHSVESARRFLRIIQDVL